MPWRKSRPFSERPGTIVSSPVELHVRRSLELMAQLKEAAAEFAQKESRLTRDHRLRRVEENREFREEP